MFEVWFMLEVFPNYSYGSNFFGAVFVNDTYMLYSSQRKDKKNIAESYKKYFTAHCSKALSCQTICPANMETLTLILKIYMSFYYYSFSRGHIPL